MDPQNDKEIMVESLENPVEETSDNESNEKDLVESFIQVDEIAMAKERTCAKPHEE